MFLVVMQADQTVISLRPRGGGGGPRSTRLFTPRFDTSSSPPTDSQPLSPHGGLASDFKSPLVEYDFSSALAAGLLYPCESYSSLGYPQEECHELCHFSAISKAGWFNVI